LPSELCSGGGRAVNAQAAARAFSSCSERPRAEQVAVLAYQNGRGAGCLKPGSQLGRVIDHDRDIAIRELLEKE
jgi:hypothetical protein